MLSILKIAIDTQTSFYPHYPQQASNTLESVSNATFT